MSVSDCIGNTPLIRIETINPMPDVTVLAKLEGNNPGGSVKDRIASICSRMPNHEGGKARTLELGRDLDGARADLAVTNAVLLLRDDPGFDLVRGCGAGFAENFANEFAYHGFKEFIGLR